MQGKIRKNALGRWEIVDVLDNRAEITSGEVIEVWHPGRAIWLKTRVEHDGRDYVAVDGNGLVTLYEGAIVRETDTPRL